MAECCNSLYPADVSCCSDWESYSDYVKCRSLEMAWATMRLLSGGRVTNCIVEMRPCLQPACDPCQGYWESSGIYPRIVAGCWVNTVCGELNGCSCPPLCQIQFPGEVAKICSVTVDGKDLQVTQWRLDDAHRLVRTDGGCWPSCQDMSLPPDCPDTMLIKYIPGIKVGAAGEYAIGALACEYGKLCSGSRCRLPSGITSIVRQGITMQLNTEQFPGGLTGIPEVDSYIMSINPYHHYMPPKVWSPDWEGSRHVFPTQESYVPGCNA